MPRGRTRSLPYLPTLNEVRLKHRPLRWAGVSIARSRAPSLTRVPAGTFATESYTVRSPGRPTLKIEVETGPARRIVRWSGSDGERAELTGSRRLKYWQMKRNRDERVFRRLLGRAATSRPAGRARGPAGALSTTPSSPRSQATPTETGDEPAIRRLFGSKTDRPCPGDRESDPASGVGLLRHGPPAGEGGADTGDAGAASCPTAGAWIPLDPARP